MDSWFREIRPGIPIIDRIESGTVGLEDSIAEYERGVDLLKLSDDGMRKLRGALTPMRLVRGRLPTGCSIRRAPPAHGAALERAVTKSRANDEAHIGERLD